jgi:hypothetical protein
MKLYIRDEVKKDDEFTVFLILAANVFLAALAY